MNSPRLDLCYDRTTKGIRPSWSGTDLYLTPEHQNIFEITKAIDGFQMPGDAYKLYEMAYHAGDVILEIGTYCGKSAVIALRGALANPKREHPQWYGIDVSKTSVVRTQETLAKWNLAQYTAVFRGDLRRFFQKPAISPTMVFLDGGHAYPTVKNDIEVLSRALCQGVPILCHDFLHSNNKDGSYGVERACTEWEQTGQVKFMGCFGCSALFVTVEEPRPIARRSIWVAFKRVLARPISRVRG